jgi:DNA-binding beta-propeller fold protein YncE
MTRNRALTCVALTLFACGRKPDHTAPAPNWTTLDLFAGQPGGAGFVDGPAAAAHFSMPYTAALDGAGHLYVIDRDVVRTVDLASGDVSTLAGPLTGVHGMVDGVGAEALFNLPQGVAATADTVWVTDTENHTVRQIDVATRTVTTIAGTPGMLGASDGVGSAALFHEPEGIVLDPAKRVLYIADTDNHTFRQLSLDTHQVTTIAGVPTVAGDVDGPAAMAQMNRPSAIVLDATATVIYFIERGSKFVRRLDLSAKTVTTLQPMQPLPDFPYGIVLAGSGLLVTVADRVLTVALDGTSGDLAGGMVPGFVDAMGDKARFSGPQGLIAASGRGVLVIDGDNCALRGLDLGTGMVTTFSGANAPGSDDGPGAHARFHSPQGLASGEKALYVADTENHVLRAVAPDGTVTTLAGAAGTLGQVDGSGAAARFNRPRGLALDAAASLLYVADTDNRALRRVNVDTGEVGTLQLDRALSGPSGLALAEGQLYVTDSTDGLLLKVDLAKGTVSVVAGTVGQHGTVDGIGEAAHFNAPMGLVADGQGHLYVADTFSNVVRAVDLATRAVRTLAGGADRVGDLDGMGTNARFFDPTWIALDAAGGLYVADSLNGLVRKVSLDTGEVSTLAGDRTLTGVKPGPLPAQLGPPTAIAFTVRGELVVASENALLSIH